MSKIWLTLFSGVLLCACSTLPDRSRSGSGIAGSSTRVEQPGQNGKKTAGFQIAQCYSAGAPRVGISYPDGWSRRVSRAETEDELLGGASTNLSKAGAYAKPVGGQVSYVYPQAALNPPTEGVCEVKFNLSRRGEPSDVISACSSSLFVEAATQAVAASKFEPVRVNGSVAKGVKLTYNMKFCLAD